jgi:hypothetical protein
LKDPETVSGIAAGLNSHPGVKLVVANPLTGGLLIEYDPARVDMESARQALQAIAPAGEDWLEEYGAARRGSMPLATVEPDISCDGSQSCSPRPGRISKDAAEYLTMTGAFAVCAGSAALRSRGWHIYSGLTLACLTVQHLYKHRKRLLAYFRNLQFQPGDTV